MSVYKRLETLHITLPPVATPAAAYVPYVKTGHLVFLSGHISKKDGQVWAGQLGQQHQQCGDQRDCDYCTQRDAA
mgnify:CR=1 FL=1